jgi:hypothetical protein
MMIAFVKYSAAESTANWIHCLEEALARRIPPAQMRVIVLENSDNLMFWKHQLRSLPSVPATVVYPLTKDPQNDMGRFHALSDFLRQWRATAVVLGERSVESPEWVPVLQDLENLGPHYAFGRLGVNPVFRLAEMIVATLDSGWYGRFDWEESGVFVPVSRAPYGNEAKGLDWARH